MIGKVQNDSLVIKPIDGVDENRADFLIRQRIGRGQGELGFEPMADREDGSFFPGQHGCQKFVFGLSGQPIGVDQTDRLIEIGLQLGTPLSVE